MNVKRGIAEFIAKMSYKEAERSANTTCVFFHGQPKMPQCVHKLRKEKNKRGKISKILSN